MEFAEGILAAAALVVALSLRPWRQKGLQALFTPLLATVVLLPWLWALPTLHSMPLQLQLSGACLVLLMLGWPLAVVALSLSAGIAAYIADWTWPQALDVLAWLGLVPATLALAIGAGVRHLLGTHPFVYVLARAFLGSLLCLFTAGLLRQWTGHALPGVEDGLSMVARWLTAWGDAMITGMLCAIFVAYRPQWLATWSDTLYLRGK